MRIPVPTGALLVLALAACAAPPPRGDAAREPPPAATAAPTASASAPAPAAHPRAAAVSAERAWKHLDAQLAMGPRANGLPGHARLVAHLQEHLRACGAVVRTQEFTHVRTGATKPATFTNVMGRFRPDAREWVLLGTHFDTRLWAEEDPDPALRDRPIEGANDGASGTAVLMEIASVLKDIPPDIGVEIVFFDGEDFGRPGLHQDYFLGSKALAREWARFHGESRPTCAVILDMVGDADLSFRRETKSIAQAAWLSDHLWNTGRAMGVAAFLATGDSPIYDDQDALLEMGIPAALIIDYEYPWWHRAGDTRDKCSPASLADTARVVLAAVVDVPVTPPAAAPDTTGGR